MVSVREMTHRAVTKILGEAGEREAYFVERTNFHVGLVQKAARRIADANPEFREFWGNALVDSAAKHDASKLEEPERTPYIDLTWQHKRDNFRSYKTPGTIPDPAINAATLHHIINNEHHPEFWNPGKANLDPENRDRSVEVVDVSKMPPLAVAEMVADWVAMGMEILTRKRGLK